MAIYNRIEHSLNITSLFEDKKELKKAKNLMKRYLADFTIVSISDINTLREVIYLEILQQRLQNSLNEADKADKAKIPLKLIEIIHKNSEAIIKLKDTLGINKENKSGSYDSLQILKSKFKEYLKINKNSRTLVCPHCSKIILLKIRIDKYEASKHPYFRDRFLYNEHLFTMYSSGRVTREDVSKVLECSTDYIDFILDKIGGKYREKDK